MASYDTPGFANGVSIVGDYAYVADGYSDSELQILDLHLSDTPIAISGPYVVGSPLTVDLSRLEDADGLPDSSTFTYQWQVSTDGGAIWTAIVDATNSTFTPDNSYLNQQVRVTVTYTDLGGTTETATSVGIEFMANPSPDFNADGNPDFFWQNTTTGELSIWYMDGMAGLGSAVPGSALPDWQMVGMDDFNGDDNPDLGWRNLVTGENQLWLMDGATLIAAEPMLTVPINYELQAVADFDGDDDADLFWRDPNAQDTVIWLMDGNAPIPIDSLTLGPVAADWVIEGVTDFDGNGNADILWRSEVTGDNTLWLFDNASGTITAEWLTPVPTYIELAGVADINQDGHPDILWHDTYTGDTIVWYMEGTASVGADYGPTVPGSDWTLTV